MVGDPSKVVSAERSGSSKKIGSGLLALSSAAVLAVYAAGYLKTRAAAERFAVADRRPNPAFVAPAVVRASAPVSVEAPAARPAPEPTLAAPVPSARPVPVRARKPRPRRAAAPSSTSAEPAAPVAAPAVVAAPEPAPVPEAKAIEAPPPAKPVLKDGTYSGWGTSRHGDIEAQVVIEGGRIVSASITQCLTRYPCSYIDRLPGQIVTRQSPECDFISGATQSTNAFYYAIVEALAKAK